MGIEFFRSKKRQQQQQQQQRNYLVQAIEILRDGVSSFKVYRAWRFGDHLPLSVHSLRVSTSLCRINV